MGISGDAFANFSRIAKILSSAAAVCEFDEVSFVNHEMVGELSFNRATCFSFRSGTTRSITSHKSSVPAQRCNFLIIKCLQCSIESIAHKSLNCIFEAGGEFMSEDVLELLMRCHLD